MSENLADVEAHKARFGEAQRLAKDEKFRCRASCNRVLPMDAGVSVNHQGVVALAVCFECLGKFDVILSRGGSGVEVKLKPRSIIIVSP